MSLAGRPKTIARKKHVAAVAKARARYEEAIKPAKRKYAEMILPAQEVLKAEIEAADADYFKAVA